jgi:hypothetical protein
VSNKIYDFKPFDRPDQASYYQLGKINAFQLRAGRGTFTNRGVSVEQILEWQVLLSFIQSDNDRCKHIVQNFNKQVEIDTVWKIKDSSGKLATEAVQITEARAIDWVAHQYPAYSKDKNPFASEFVSLHDGVNGRKERVC